MGWEAVVAVLGSLALAWLALVALLHRAASRTPGLDRPGALEAVRMLPDVLRLLRRLSADGSLPRRVRVALWLLLGYLILPVDVVPDFLPVIGYADDVLVILLVLRAVTRAAEPAALDRHWTGTPEGLRALKRLAGLP